MFVKPIYEKVSYSQAPKQTQLIYDDICLSLNIENKERIPNWASYVGGSPEVLSNTWQLIKAGVINNPLSPIMKELIMVAIATLSRSPYCQTVHSYNAIKLTNLTYAELKEIIEGTSQALLPDAYHAAVQAAKDFCQSDCLHNEEVVARLKESGFEESDIAHLIHLVTVSVFVSNFTRIMNLPVEEGLEAHLDKSEQKFICF